MAEVIRKKDVLLEHISRDIKGVRCTVVMVVKTARVALC